MNAPGASLLRRELRAVREPFRLLARTSKLQAAPTGERGVMVLPGFSTNDTAMAPLRAYLRSRGHRVWGWGLGTNRGDVPKNLPAVIDQVERRVVENDDNPLALVGWSLGGVFAREVARDRPELVDQLITLATPIFGGPRYTEAARDFSEAELQAIEARISERQSRPIQQPLTAYFTKADGALDWRTTLDHLHPQVEMIEVDSSHLGITLDPVVWLGIAERLAATDHPPVLPD